MTTYTAPVEDMMFLFEKLRNNKDYNDLEKYKEVTPELVKDILEEAAKINQNIILPLAKLGDENPTTLENGIVRTPPGYKEAYKKFIEDGWTSLSCDPKYGGQGMVGPLYLVILNMEVKECQKRSVLFLTKCYLQQAYHLNFIAN